MPGRGVESAVRCRRATSARGTRRTRSGSNPRMAPESRACAVSARTSRLPRRRSRSVTATWSRTRRQVAAAPPVQIRSRRDEPASSVPTSSAHAPGLPRAASEVDAVARRRWSAVARGGSASSSSERDRLRDDSPARIAGGERRTASARCSSSAAATGMAPSLPRRSCRAGRPTRPAPAATGPDDEPADERSDARRTNASRPSRIAGRTTLRARRTMARSEASHRHVTCRDREGRQQAPRASETIATLRSSIVPRGEQLGLVAGSPRSRTCRAISGTAPAASKPPVVPREAGTGTTA